MKKIALLLAAAALLTISTSCGREQEPAKESQRVTSEQVKQKAQQALDATKAYVEQKKDELLKSMDDEYQAVDKKIADLQSRANQETGEKKAELSRQLEDLEKKKETAVKKLGALKSASAESWKQIRSDAVQALEDLKKSYDKVAAEF